MSGIAITQQQLVDASTDAQALADVVNSSADAVSTRLGGTVPTLRNMLSRIGFETPVAYAAGIGVIRVSQTVAFNNVLYFPVQNKLPFTTTSTFDNTEWIPVTSFIGDAQFVKYAPAVTGAVSRTVLDKLLEHVSVKDFGAKGNAVTDDTAAIHAAVAYISSVGGGTIYFPAGRYIITSDITTPTGAITFKGDGMYACVIQQNTLTANIFTISQPNCSILDIGLAYPSPATNGHAILAGTGVKGAVARTLVNNVDINNAFNCITSWAENTSQYNNVFGNRLQNFGFWFNQTDGATLSNFGFSSSNPAFGICIFMQGDCQGCIASFGETSMSLRSLSIDVVGGSIPDFNKFSCVYFDSGSIEALINNGAGTSFDNCWFSNGRSGAGFPGLLINAGDTIRFTNTDFANCGKSGCVVAGGSNITFASCSFYNNSVSSSGVKHGLEIGAGASKFSVIGCSTGNFTNVFPFSTQSIGISIAAGASDNFSLIGNNASGNLTAAIVDSSTGAHKVIYGNEGCVTSAKGTAGVAAAATSVVVTHGLSITPTINDVSVTALTDNGSGSRYWVSAVTATNFTLNLLPAPGSTAFFAWQVRTAGA